MPHKVDSDETAKASVQVISACQVAEQDGDYESDSDNDQISLKFITNC